MSDPQRDLRIINTRLALLEESARAATPGRWRRNHGVITTKVPGEHDPSKFEGYVVAMADIYDTQKGSLMGHSGDPKRAYANSRYIEAASPHNILSLIERLRSVLPAELEALARIKADAEDCGAFAYAARDGRVCYADAHWRPDPTDLALVLGVPVKEPHHA